MTTPTSLPVYTQGYGTAFTGATVVAPFAPGSTNIQGPNGPFKIGQIWVDSTTEEGYILVAINSFNGITTSLWQQFSSTSGLLETLTGNTGGPISPIAGNINILGVGTLSIDGSGNTLSISHTENGYPITPYVVGPVGKAGYQTIQSAVNDANAGGGGAVYIQSGIYTENLTLYTGVSLVGVAPPRGITAPTNSSPITINGNHTLAIGNSPSPVAVSRLNFVATGNLFATAAAIPVGMIIVDCTVRATGGYVISVPNLTISTSVYFILQNCSVFDGGTIFTNSSINMTIQNSYLAVNGSSPIQQINSGSSWSLNNVTNPDAINMASTSNLIMVNCIMLDTITAASGTCNIASTGSYHFTDTDPSFVINGTSSLQINNSEIGSSATYTIDGTSSGTNYLNGLVFTQNATVNPALIVTNTSTVLAGGALLGTTTPDATSLFTMASTTKGFLPPRMTTTQKNAIVSPSEGLVVYDTDLHQLSYYNGTAWTNV